MTTATRWESRKCTTTFYAGRSSNKFCSDTLITQSIFAAGISGIESLPVSFFVLGIQHNDKVKAENVNKASERSAVLHEAWTDPVNKQFNVSSTNAFEVIQTHTMRRVADRQVAIYFTVFNFQSNLVCVIFFLGQYNPQNSALKFMNTLFRVYATDNHFT